MHHIFTICYYRTQNSAHTSVKLNMSDKWGHHKSWKIATFVKNLASNVSECKLMLEISSVVKEKGAGHH